MSRIEWRIYYGDGTTFDNTMGLPNEAPPVNIQAIVGYDKDVGRMVLHYWDWYYFRNNDFPAWWGCDVHGLLDQLLWDKNGEITTIKQGRTLGNSEYKEILQRAIHDEDFPRKSARKPLEKPEQVYGEGLKEWQK